jgi:putative oxidoreductase
MPQVARGQAAAWRGPEARVIEWLWSQRSSQGGNALATSGPSHPYLSYTDGLAASSADIILLIGRILLGWLFLKNGWDKVMNITGFVGYLTNLKVPNPGLWAWPAAISEVVIGAALILGVATRYAALFMLVYLIITIVLAHRYWDYPAAQQGNQFNHFLKNLAIMGGALVLFVTGPGRFSLDSILAKRR